MIGHTAKEFAIVLGVIFIWTPLFLLWCAWDWLRNRFKAIIEGKE